MLDNSKSTVAVSWQASAVENLPSGAPWARITPVISGTVAAGRTQSITVTPDTLLCRYSLPRMIDATIVRAHPCAAGARKN